MALVRNTKPPLHTLNCAPPVDRGPSNTICRSQGVRKAETRSSVEVDSGLDILLSGLDVGPGGEAGGFGCSIGGADIC